MLSPSAIKGDRNALLMPHFQSLKKNEYDRKLVEVKEANQKLLDLAVAQVGRAEAEKMTREQLNNFDPLLKQMTGVLLNCNDESKLNSGTAVALYF